MSDLPTGWVETAISEVVQTKVEQRVPLSNKYFYYIDISSIDRITKKIVTPQRLSGKKAPSRARQVVASGDVLVSMTRPNLNAVAVVPSDLNGQIASTGFDVLRAMGIESRWLYYIVRTNDFIATMSNLVQGAVYPAVRSRDIRNYAIPLAPLNEQKRVIEKLDQLLARVDSCQSHLEHVQQILKRFRQSVLVAATSGELTASWRSNKGLSDETTSFDYPDAKSFGEYEFPATWQAIRLRDIADIMGGITKDSKKQSSADKEFPYLRVANVQRGYFDLREIKTIRIPKHRVKELLLKAGDILFNEGGDIDKLGRGWVWNGEIKRCVFQNHIFRARLKNTSFVPKYFSHYGNSRGYDYFLQYGKQTTNLASISKTVLESLPVAVPPADEQLEIVHRIENLFALADRFEARLGVVHERVSQLTSSLLAKAFRGELVEQNLNDELVSELLKRVKLERENMSKETKKPRRQINTSKVKMEKGSVRPGVIQVLKNSRKELSAQQLFQLAGYPLDAEPELVEEFFVEVRNALTDKQIERERRNDTDWFKLHEQ